MGCEGEALGLMLAEEPLPAEGTDVGVIFLLALKAGEAARAVCGNGCAALQVGEPIVAVEYIPCLDSFEAVGMFIWLRISLLRVKKK
jgi:hypothetical protein